MDYRKTLVLVSLIIILDIILVISGFINLFSIELSLISYGTILFFFCELTLLIYVIIHVVFSHWKTRNNQLEDKFLGWTVIPTKMPKDIYTPGRIKKSFNNNYYVQISTNPKITIAGSCVQGSSHKKRGSVCQDAFAFSILGDREAVIAVADGVGSVPFSDEGARLAVDAVVNYIKSVELKQIESKDFEDILTNSVEQAREKIFQHAKINLSDPNDYACTLLCAIYFNGMIQSAHVGDGGIVISVQNIFILLSEPEKSEFCNIVVPITSVDWRKSLRISDLVNNVDAFALFTDGCQRAVLQKEDGKYIPFNRFFEPLFFHAKEYQSYETLAEEIHSLLISQKISETSDDDKTLVIGCLSSQYNNRNIQDE